VLVGTEQCQTCCRAGFARLTLIFLPNQPGGRLAALLAAFVSFPDPTLRTPAFIREDPAVDSLSGRKAGRQATGLAPTELPLSLKQDHTRMPLIDSAKAHVKAVVAFILGDCQPSQALRVERTPPTGRESLAKWRSLNSERRNSRTGRHRGSRLALRIGVDAGARSTILVR